MKKINLFKFLFIFMFFNCSPILFSQQPGDTLTPEEAEEWRQLEEWWQTEGAQTEYTTLEHLKQKFAEQRRATARLKLLKHQEELRKQHAAAQREYAPVKATLPSEGLEELFECR